MSNPWSEVSAKVVSEQLLEETGNALLNRDFESFAKAFHVPQTVTTYDRTIELETVDDLRRVFEQMCTSFESLSVTDYVRECVAAEFKSKTVIETTHVSHLIRNGTHVMPPYPVYSTLEMKDGRWKVSGGAYAVDQDTGQARALASGQSPQADASDK